MPMFLAALAPMLGTATVRTGSARAHPDGSTWSMRAPEAARSGVRPAV